MAERKPIISFRNFSFQYRAQKRPTLTDINLEIYPGERERQEHAGGVHQRAESVFQPRRVHRHPDRGRCGCAPQQHL